MPAVAKNKVLPSSVRPRLRRWVTLGCLAVCMAVLGATGAAQWSLHELDTDIRRTFDVSIPRARLALDLTNQMAQCHEGSLEFVVHWDAPKARTAMVDALKMNLARLVDLVERLREHTEAPAESDRFRAWVVAFREYGRRINEINHQLDQRQLTGLSAVREAVRSCQEYLEPTHAEITSLASTLKKLHFSSHGLFRQTIARQQELVNLRAVAALIVAIVSTMWFHGRVLRRVRVMTAAIEQWLAGEHRVWIVASGDDELDCLAQRCNDLMAQEASPLLAPPSTLTADLDALAQATGSYMPAATSLDNDTAFSSDYVDEPGPLRVLIADDGPENRRLMTLVLRRAGVETANAENGLQAVEIALGKSFDGTADPTAVPYDLVLLDMQMPIMDGYQAARQMRQEGYAGLIVAVTGNPEREQCIDAGCDEYLRKPVDRDMLLALIHRVQAGELRAAENATA